jgi:ABC-type phosphate transport system substrate-binding protein
MVLQRDISLHAYLSASGSSGVATSAANTPYSLTYVESGYAKSAGLGLAALKERKWQLPNA